MPFVKSPAFVLKTSNYSETSLIVTLYTLEEGKTRCMAKGARRPKSPFAGKLETLNEVEAVYIRGKSELYTLKECSITHTHIGLREKLEKLNSALRMLSLVDETQTVNDPHPGVFQLILTCLNAIENSPNLPAILVFFRSRILSESGYAPDYSNCASCKRVLKGPAGYSARRNGFLCHDCAGKEGHLAVSAGTMQILRRTQKAGLETVLRMKISDDQKEETKRLFEKTFETIFERKFSSGRILDSIEKSTT